MVSQCMCKESWCCYQKQNQRSRNLQPICTTTTFIRVFTFQFSFQLSTFSFNHEFRILIKPKDCFRVRRLALRKKLWTNLSTLTRFFLCKATNLRLIIRNDTWFCILGVEKVKYFSSFWFLNFCFQIWIYNGIYYWAFNEAYVVRILFWDVKMRCN